MASWSRITGVVTDNITDSNGEASYPEIEFQWQGAGRRFKSSYGGAGLRIGRKVEVIFDPVTGAAEHLTRTNRWHYTVWPLGFAALFIWLAL